MSTMFANIFVFYSIIKNNTAEKFHENLTNLIILHRLQILLCLHIRNVTVLLTIGTILQFLDSIVRIMLNCLLKKMLQSISYYSLYSGLSIKLLLNY